MYHSVWEADGNMQRATLRIHILFDFILKSKFSGTTLMQFQRFTLSTTE